MPSAPRRASAQIPALTPGRVLTLWEPSRKLTGGQISAWVALLQVHAAGDQGVLIQQLGCSSSFVSHAQSRGWIRKVMAEDARTAPGRCPMRAHATPALGALLGMDSGTAAAIIGLWLAVAKPLQNNLQAWLMLLQYAARGSTGALKSRLESTANRAQIGQALRRHGHLVPTTCPHRWRVPQRVLIALGFAPYPRTAYHRAAL